VGVDWAHPDFDPKEFAVTDHPDSPAPSGALEYPEGRERNALADLLLELGPDAPTLCADWTTRDLAIHMVLIERRPDSWVGGPVSDKIPKLRGHFDRIVENERKRPWPELVDRLRVGPRHGPFRSHAARNRMFLREYVIHHEDARRARGAGPRPGLDEIQEAMWNKLKGFARFLKVEGDAGLEFVHPDGRILTIRKGAPAAQLTGEPIELLLYLFGRTSVAKVELSGDPAAQEAVRVRDSSKLRALPITTEL
jgi:uncharacterized protein (TIGR03085 family)